MKLLLLHGALGSSAQMETWRAELSGFADVDILDFSGHGGKEIPEHFTIAGFADNVLEYMMHNGLEKIDILGYSMGGYAGLYLCRHYPEKINRLMTIATKQDWNPEGAVREVKMLNPEIIEQKIPAFAEQLRKRHAPADWKMQMQKTAEMMLDMGNDPPLKEEDYRQVMHAVKVCVGDRDKMVNLEETIRVYRLLPNGSCWVIPSTDHPIEKMPVKNIAAEAKEFFS